MSEQMTDIAKANTNVINLELLDSDTQCTIMTTNIIPLKVFVSWYKI